MNGKCLLVLTACCLGLGSSRALTADNPLITSKISERRSKDGKLQWRAETVSRGKSRILRIQQSFKGGTTNTFRMYLVGGETLMVETDEDRDGILESFALYHPVSKDMEAFTRQSNGSVKPAPAHVLETYKKERAIFAEFFDFDKHAGPDGTDEQIRETQKKLRELEKPKMDGKK